jgi:hypothetical protein
VQTRTCVCNHNNNECNSINNMVNFIHFLHASTESQLLETIRSIHALVPQSAGILICTGFKPV